MTKTLLITGASSGIGLACASKAADQSLKVFATARSQNKLLKLQSRYPTITIIIADIATKEGRTKIVNAIDQPINYLLHNAALLIPPEPFMQLQLNEFQQHMATNVEPILFLTQELLMTQKLMNNASRIMHVSTGAAQQAIKGMGHYCVSKSAALMASQMLKAELNECGILVNDYFPGVVDTAMQKTLRNAQDEVFPYSSTFNDYKKNNQLAKPDDIATHIVDIFHSTNDITFSEKPWEFKQ